MAAPFNADDFVFKKIAVCPETEEERDEFIGYMRSDYPQYTGTIRSGHPIGTQYVVGYDGNGYMQCSLDPATLPRHGYSVVTYQELCSMSCAWDDLSVEDLLQ